MKERNLILLEIERQQVVDREMGNTRHMKLGSKGRRFAANRLEVANLHLEQAKGRIKYGP